jgi:glycosyltransferase involved in cell wall biosynthesis
VIGRLVREKGYFELLEAFVRVVGQVEDARLVTIGGALESDHDDAATEIHAMARELAIGHRVHFLSFRDDVERILAASDVFVLPSHREGMPRSLLEAMAMGLPSVVTDIRGSREAITEGETGRIVPVGDVERLAEAMIELLGDSELAARFGAAAQRYAREHFDERVVIAQQVEVLRRLCQEKGVR